MSRKLQVRLLSEYSLSELANSIVSSIGHTMQTSLELSIELDLAIIIVEINTYLESLGATKYIYEELLKIVLNSDTLDASIRFTCLQMLLNESVQILVTQVFPISYYEKILQVITAQGRGIRYLNLKGVWVKEDNMSFMYELIKHLPYLKRLIIPHIANDDLLKHIGLYSKSLKLLDISGETDITEIGIEYLCYGISKNNLSIVDIGSLGEENICHMDIALLIFNSPNLTSLVSYSFVGKSLLYIYENRDPKFKCKLNYIHDTGTNKKTMNAIVELCPKLEQVYLDTPDNGVLQKLSSVKLTRLKIYKFYCAELYPLLEEIGKYVLEHLTLIKGRGQMEIERIIRSCFILRDLDFYMMDSLSYNGDYSFQKLQGLEILSSPLSTSSLKNFICRTTSLKRLAVDTVNFTDEDMHW